VEWPTVEELYTLYKKDEDIDSYTWSTKKNIPFYNKRAFGWDTQSFPEKKEKYLFSNTTYPWSEQDCLPLKLVYKQQNTSGVVTRSNPASTPISRTPSVSEAKRSKGYNFEKDRNYSWLSLEEAY
jgi:hypothetical protein